MLGGIGSDGEWGRWIRHFQDRLHTKYFLEDVKRPFASGRPFPRGILLGEVNEGSGNVGIARDKSSVEICKAKEGSYVLDLGWGGPVCNALYLY